MDNKHWQEYWEREKIYAFDPLSKKKVYSVDTPPPTVSGEMHIGHACSYAQQDFFVRYKRICREISLLLFVVNFSKK